MTTLREAAQQALDALNGVLDTYGEPLDLLSISGGTYEALQCRDAITHLRTALAEPQIDDPASHFCHRFAILMECMLLSNDINLDKYWDVAHALLDEYNSARDKRMEAQGQPYVSGFGKD